MKLFLEKNINKIVLTITALVSASSLYYYYNAHLILAYNDATSHLNIARRVVDSLTPGIVQIGSTWLPLLHLLEIPFIWNSTLWHTGLAGSFVSTTCYILSGYFLFRIVFLITKSKLSGLIGLVVFLTNANMLYMQTMAMFEPLLILNALGVSYFLLRWTHSNQLYHLLGAAIFALMGSLSRYDGWFLLAGSAAYVFIYSWVKRNFSKAEGSLIIFSTLAGMGIFCWLIYNFAIFGNPLYFAKNEYSAYSQQSELLGKGLLPSKGDLGFAVIEYSLASMLNQGIVYSIFGFIGFIYFLLKNKKNSSNWVLLLLTIPFIFNVFALYEGHSVIWMPNLEPYVNSFFNVRYGLLTLPFVAVFTGYLSRNNGWKLLIIPGIILQVLLFYPNKFLHSENSSLVLSNDTVASINEPTQDATNWLSNNYKGGLILISSASSEAFIFNTGIEMKKFITEGTGIYWQESLINPEKYASYAVFFPSYTDRVGLKMKENISLSNNFTPVYESQTYVIYLRNDILDSDLPSIPVEKVQRTQATKLKYPFEYTLIVRAQNKFGELQKAYAKH